jgi:hypothetical protein
MQNDGPWVVLLDLKLPLVDGVEMPPPGVNSYIVRPVDFQQVSKAVGQVRLRWVLLDHPPRGG